MLNLAHTLRAAPMAEAAAMPPGAVPLVIGGVTLALEVGDLIDLPTERTRLTKEIAAHATDIDRTARKLGNAEFVAKAPEEVVEHTARGSRRPTARLEVMVERLGKLGQARSRSVHVFRFVQSWQ